MTNRLEAVPATPELVARFYEGERPDEETVKKLVADVAGRIAEAINGAPGAGRK